MELLHGQLCSLVSLVCCQADSSLEVHADTGDDAATPTNEDNDIESSVVTLKNQPLTVSSMFVCYKGSEVVAFLHYSAPVCFSGRAL